MGCSRCGLIGDIYTVLEKKNHWNKEIVDREFKKILNLVATDEDVERLLKYYENNKFDLVPITKNGKAPIELGWTTKEHKDKEEWKKWLADGLNIGVKTGKCSGITVIDIDTKDKNSELVKQLSSIPTLIQETNKGFHLFFQYEEDLPKTRIDKFKIDLQNNGAQVVIFPSVINNYQRNFIDLRPIVKMPDKFKELLKANLTSSWKEFKGKPISTQLESDIIPEGNRHHVLMHLGGIIRKRLNKDDTSFVLDVINERCCNPKMDRKEFYLLLNSINKYTAHDNSELVSKVLKYMRIVEECFSKDVQDALGFKKEVIDEVLCYLVREGLLMKKRRLFSLIQKAEWKEEFLGECQAVNFKMPYFYDHSMFRDGDMLVLGGGPKVGKTQISLNIIKRLVEQNVKPYYVCLESGNRFSTISQHLGMKSGDFKYCVHYDPEAIELEEGAVTILDWLLPKDYASTDKIFAHFSKQLIKQGGILIIFVQLKSDGSFFAANMLPFFPAFVAKYLYDEDTGETGHFEIDYMREPLLHKKRGNIPCKYFWKTKELKRIDEIND